MEWRYNEISEKELEKISKENEINKILTQILYNRNYSAEDINELKNNSQKYITQAEKLANAKEAALKIKKHIINNSDIFIYSDYDADGLNSGYILHKVIKETIAKIKSKSYVTSYYPERREGFGLNIDYCKKIIDNKTNDVLLITTDNGISKIEEVNLLINNDIDVLITDHHQNVGDVPNCLICNPHNSKIKQNDEFKHLCGAGVVFKICELLQKEFGYFNMYKYLPNLAIATIADMMPLTKENITFIEYGIYIMNSNDCPLWITELKKYLGIDIINPMNISWDIGPRLNAGGRMDNTNICAKLLFSENREEIQEIIRNIEIINNNKKEITKKKTKELIDDNNSLLNVYTYDDIPVGLVGIIAAKAVEKFGKPSIAAIKNNEICNGSARSIEGIGLSYLFANEVINNNIINFGGHDLSCGIAFEYDKIKELKKSFTNQIMMNITINEMVKAEKDENKINIDKTIKIKDLNKDNYDAIYQIPYNSTDMPKPIFSINNCIVLSAKETKNNVNNMWLTIKQNNDIMKIWVENGMNMYKIIGQPRLINIAGYFEKDFINNGKYMIKILDMKIGG